jgi:hypothetical protein
MVPSGQPTDTTVTLPPGEKVTIKGKIMCLPHKNMNGPISMECAIGLKGMDGKYYAVVDSDPTYAHMSQLPMNETVTITGTFQPKTDDKYPTTGILTIESVGK